MCGRCRWYIVALYAINHTHANYYTENVCRTFAATRGLEARYGGGDGKRVSYKEVVRRIAQDPDFRDYVAAALRKENSTLDQRALVSYATTLYERLCTTAHSVPERTYHFCAELQQHTRGNALQCW